MNFILAAAFLSQYSNDDIKNGMAARNSSFQNVIFTMELTVKYRQFIGGNFKTQNQISKLSFDTNKFMKSEQRHLINGNSIDSVFYYFNNETTLISTITRTQKDIRTKSITCVIRDGLVGPFPVSIPSLIHIGRYDPMAYTSNYKYLQSIEYERGVNLARLDWEADDPAPEISKRKGSYWVSPEKNFMIVQSAEYRKPTDALPWKEVNERIVRETEKCNGYYFPKVIKSVEHKYYNNGNYEKTADIELVLNNIVVNDKLDTNYFRPAVPEGAVVSDRKRGRSYIYRTLSNEELARQVEVAKQLSSIPLNKAKRVSSQGTNQSVSVYISIGLITFSTATILIIVVYKKKLSKPKNIIVN
jgi:hypothetical protein